MATITFFTSFYTELGLGSHNLNTHTIKAAVTNTLPVVSQTVFDPVTNHPPPTNTDGYTAGGHDTQNVFSAGKMTMTDIVLTAGAGTLGAFKYVILYNADASDKLVGFITYANSITLAAGETFTIDFDAANGVLTIP
jgi:hypothetical protein